MKIHPTAIVSKKSQIDSSVQIGPYAIIEEGRGVFPKGTPRIIMSGCPMAVPNWKLPWIIETAGAVIVGEESCVGERGTRNLTDDSGNTGAR